MYELVEKRANMTSTHKHTQTNGTKKYAYNL